MTLINLLIYGGILDNHKQINLKLYNVWANLVWVNLYGKVFTDKTVTH